MVQIHVWNAALLKVCAAVHLAGKKKKGRVPDLLAHQTQGSMNTIKLCGKLVSTYKVLVQLQDRYICGLSVKT